MANIGGQSTITLPTVFQITGNSTTEKFIGDVAVVQIKRILSAEGMLDPTEMMMMTAEQVSMSEGFEQGQYVFPERQVWGSTYDPVSGTTQQSVGARRAIVLMDQLLAFKYNVPSPDTNRLMSSPVEVRAGIIGEWMRTMTENWYQNISAIYFQGVIDSCIAQGQFVTKAIPTDADTAQQTFYELNDLAINYIQTVNPLMVGASRKDLKFMFAMKPFAQLTKAYTKILDNTAADTFAKGNLYKNAILGTDALESWYLGKQFPSGKEAGLNLDMAFNLNGNPTINVWGMLGHVQDCAMPQGWKSIQQVIDQNTGDIRYMGRGIYSLPTFMRNLTTIICATAPTNADITAAQANLGITYNLAPWIDLVPPTLPQLSTVITQPVLGEITTGGGNPTTAQLNTAITALNSGFTAGDAVFSNIQATSAIATGNGTTYQGTVNLSFTVA